MFLNDLRSDWVYPVLIQLLLFLDFCWVAGMVQFWLLERNRSVFVYTCPSKCISELLPFSDLRTICMCAFFLILARFCSCALVFLQDAFLALSLSWKNLLTWLVFQRGCLFWINVRRNNCFGRSCLLHVYMISERLSELIFFSFLMSSFLVPWPL